MVQQNLAEGGIQAKRMHPDYLECTLISRPARDWTVAIHG